MPRGMDFHAAAALGAAYSTAYTGLVELGGLREGQWVLVHGASGGVGLAACDLARALGARVIATTGSADKCERIAALVRPEAVILAAGRFREQVADITGGHLADIVFDPVGGDVFDESTRCVAFGGKLMVVGFTSGRIADISTNIPLIKGFSVVGLRAGEYARRFPERGRAIHAAINALAEEGRITPAIDRTLPLSRWREGFKAMAQRQLVPPGSATIKAIDYSLKRWAALTRYLDDPHLPIDNNRAENAIRPFVIGRKNWLFSDTPKGVTASAQLYSLVETAKANGQEPYAYLRHILERLPQATTVEGYEALLPWSCKLTQVY